MLLLPVSRFIQRREPEVRAPRTAIWGDAGDRS
jgi:hypothetical protein